MSNSKLKSTDLSTLTDRNNSEAPNGRIGGATLLTWVSREASVRSPNSGEFQPLPSKNPTAFGTFGVDLGYFVNISLQFSYGKDASGNGIFVIAPTFGLGFGAAVYQLTTNTAAAGIRRPCGQ